MPDLDDCLLAALDEQDVAAVERWCACLGIGPSGWARVPAFKSVIELLAILTTADRLREADPGISEKAAFQRAAELVGFEDDPARSTGPAETPARRLRDWLNRAWPDRGENLRARRSA